MMKLCINITFFLFVASAISAIGQVDSTFYKREIQLKTYLTSLRAAANNQEKDKCNQQFKEYLLETIKMDGAFAYPFSQLKTLGSIKSPDNTFRLFNWNVELDDHSNNYFCFVLRFDDKKHEWKTIELVDNSANLAPHTEDILDEKNWYGALYYKIIPVSKSNKTVYTVLAWDGNVATNSKMLDVISFTSSNHAKFGSPIFKMKDGTHKRLFFEHSKKAFMSLNYDEQRNRIVYDHLSPETPSLEGFYEYYVPDFSYDELRFENNKWLVTEDIVGINSQANKTYTLKHINAKNGEVVSEEQKNKWVDPTDLNAPAGPNNHVAVLPENTKSTKVKPTSESGVQIPRSTKKVRRSEFSMNPYYHRKGRQKRK